MTRLATLALAVVLSACAQDPDDFFLNTDEITETAIARWEEVDGAEVSQDFRNTLVWQYVGEDGDDDWHPACEQDWEPIAGCTIWIPQEHAFHLQILAGQRPYQTTRTAYHEITHALLRHHYGDIDPGHMRAEWYTVTKYIMNRVGIDERR